MDPARSTRQLLKFHRVVGIRQSPVDMHAFGFYRPASPWTIDFFFCLFRADRVRTIFQLLQKCAVSPLTKLKIRNYSTLEAQIRCLQPRLLTRYMVHPIMFWPSPQCHPLLVDPARTLLLFTLLPPATCATRVAPPRRHVSTLVLGKKKHTVLEQRGLAGHVAGTESDRRYQPWTWHVRFSRFTGGAPVPRVDVQKQRHTGIGRWMSARLRRWTNDGRLWPLQLSLRFPGLRFQRHPKASLHLWRPRLQVTSSTSVQYLGRLAFQLYWFSWE